MKVMFEKCSEAISYTEKSGMFGGFYSCRNDENKNIHIHNCCEVLFCISGGKNFFIHDRIYEVDCGDIFIINQFENHKITSDDNCVFERYVLQINPEFLHRVSSELTDLSQCFYIRNKNISHKIPTTPEQFDTLLNLFQRLNNDTGYGDEIIKEIIVTEILVLINESFIENNKDYTYTSNCENKNLYKALKFINDNYDKEISLDIISKNIYISQNELCALFKNYLGTTVKKYITSRRITKAKKLLNKGNTVSETAFLCGFDDYTSFIRSFKQAVGMPPGKYKKSQMQGRE